MSRDERRAVSQIHLPIVVVRLSGYITPECRGHECRHVPNAQPVVEVHDVGKTTVVKMRNIGLLQNCMVQLHALAGQHENPGDRDGFEKTASVNDALQASQKVASWAWVCYKYAHQLASHPFGVMAMQ